MTMFASVKFLVFWVAPVIMSDFAQMKRDLDTLAAEKMAQQGPGDLRLIPEMLSVYFDSIDEYGCWCNFQETHVLGKGVPVNEVDEWCKTLSDGYTCIGLDTFHPTLEEPTCIPWEVQYRPGTTAATIDQLESFCNALNPGDCQKQACKVEGQFVMKMYEALTRGTTFNETFLHSNGFEPSEQCVPRRSSIKNNSNGGGGGGGGAPTTIPPHSIFHSTGIAKQCCGQYPNRFPYMHIENVRGCCGAHTYNPFLKDCCDDGIARVAC